MPLSWPAGRRGCWELAGKRKWRPRGPGRAEVQEEGGALNRDPGWRRLIPLRSRSWRWGLWSPKGWAEGDPVCTGESPYPRYLWVWEEKR